MATMAELADEIRAERPQEVQVERPTTAQLADEIRAERAASDAPVDLGGQRPQVDPDSVSSTVGRAVDNMQANYGGTAEAFGEALGIENLASWGSEFRDKQKEEASQYGQPTTPQSYKDVDWKEAGEVGGYLADMGLGSLPGMGTIMGGAVAGSKLAPGGIYGKTVGGFVGAFMASLGINAGEIQNGIKEIDPEAKSPWTALAGGSFNAALDAGGAGVLLRPVLKAVGPSQVINGLVKQGLGLEAAKGLVQGALVEGGIGAAQSLASDTAKASGTGTQLTEDYIDHMIDSAIGGALLGGGLGAGARAKAALDNNGMVAGSAYEAPVLDPAAQAKQDKKDQAPQSLAGKVWSTMGGTSTDMIKGLSEASPTAKEFKELFRPDMTGKEASSKTLFEDADLLAGKWRQDTNHILEGKSEAELSALFDEVSQPAHMLQSPEAIQLRNVLDDVHNEAQARNLDTIGYVEGHLPVRLDRDLLIDQRDAFVNELVAAGRARPDAEKALDDYLEKTDPELEQDMFPKINRMVEINPQTGKLEIAEASRKDPNDPDSMRYRLGQGSTTPEFGHLEQTRAFGELPQTTLNKYAKEQTGKEKAQAVKDYFEGAGHRLAFSKVFGEKGELANGMIAKAVKEAQDKGRKVEKREIDRMYDLLDAYNGLHGRVKDARVRQLQSTVGAVMTMKALPLAALSSLSEVMTPAIRGDVQAAAMSVLPTVAQFWSDAKRQLFKGVPRTEFSQVAAEAGITWEAATSVAAERLGTNMLSRGASKVTRGYFVLNGLSLITHMTRVYAAKTGDYVYNRNLLELANGLPLDSAQGLHRLNQLRSMGVSVGSTADALALYSPSSPAEYVQANEARKLAVRRFTDQSVLEPNLGSTPLWMNEGRFQMIAMLKRYPAAFGNTILPQLQRRFKPEYAGSYSRAASGAVGSAFLFGMMLGIGYIQDDLKQIAKKGEIDYEDTRTEGQRLSDIASQVVMPLQMGLMMDAMYNSPRYGSSPVESVMGPAAGSVKEFVQAGNKTIQSFADDPTAGYAAKYLFGQTPFRAFEKAKELINESVGLD